MQACSEDGEVVDMVIQGKWCRHIYGNRTLESAKIQLGDEVYIGWHYDNWKELEGDVIPPFHLADENGKIGNILSRKYFLLRIEKDIYIIMMVLPKKEEERLGRHTTCYLAPAGSMEEYDAVYQKWAYYWGGGE